MTFDAATLFPFWQGISKFNLFIGCFWRDRTRQRIPKFNVFYNKYFS